MTKKKKPQTRLDYSDRTQCVGIVSRTVQDGLQGWKVYWIIAREKIIAILNGCKSVRNSPNRRTMGNVQGVGFAGPWIPELVFAGTGTIMRPRLFMGYKNESYK